MLTDVVRHRAPGSEPGVELALIEWPGAGPPALLHHANGFCAALWAPVAELLARHFRVFAVDARGHGDSSKPEGEAAYAWGALALDVGRVADFVLDLTGADAIGLGAGHSFGGTLTLAAAAARDGRYQRAMLIDPVVIPKSSPPPPTTDESGTPSRAERARRRRHRFASRAEARAYFAGKPLFESWSARALSLYVEEGLDDCDDGVELKCPGRVEAAIYGGNAAFDPFAVAEKANLPLRIVRASRSDFPRSVYEQLIARLPQGELVEIEGGHLVVMERPEAVADEMLDFAGVR